MELEDVRDRSADFDSDIERDILDEDDDEDVVVLEKADAAAISRERSLNRSANGTSIEPGPKKPKPIHVNPHQRVQEFPDECLAVSGGGEALLRCLSPYCESIKKCCGKAH